MPTLPPGTTLHSLSRGLLTNKGELGENSVRNEAIAHSRATPAYKSNGEETRYYNGYFRADSNNTKLALLSDDGTSVWIDATPVLTRANQGQGFENFDSTFSLLPKTFVAGQVYHLFLQYTNTSHQGEADVDGFSLWAYDGGGDIVPAPTSPSVSKIQYQSGTTFVDMPTTFYMPVGAQMTFKAIPTPNIPWPSGKPNWSSDSGLSLGATTTISYREVGQKTLSATSGDGRVVTANIVVFDFTPTLTAVDDFEGRSTNTFGIGEDINLTPTVTGLPAGGGSGGLSSASLDSSRSFFRAVSFQNVVANTTPSVNVSVFGGLRWVLNDGNGTLADSGMNDGIGSYGVGDDEGVFTLDLQIASGPFAGFGRAITVAQVVPTGVSFTKIRPGDHNDLAHTQYTASVAFNALAKLVPSNVSFSRLEVQEGWSPSIVTDWLRLKKEYDNQGIPLTDLNHPIGPRVPVGPFFPSEMQRFGLPASLGSGPWVQATDGIGNGPFSPFNRNPPYGDIGGTFRWNIPWLYIYPGKAPRQFATARHFFQVFNTGESRISKGDGRNGTAGPYSRLPNDPSSGFAF